MDLDILNLKDRAEVILYENITGKNNAERIGSLFFDIIDMMKYYVSIKSSYDNQNSINSNERKLYDKYGYVVVDYGNYCLKENDTIKVDWKNGLLFKDNNHRSIDFYNERLYNDNYSADDYPAFDWSGFQKRIYHGVLFWAENNPTGFILQPYISANYDDTSNTNLANILKQITDLLHTYGLAQVSTGG